MDLVSAEIRCSGYTDRACEQRLYLFAKTLLERISLELHGRRKHTALNRPRFEQQVDSMNPDMWRKLPQKLLEAEQDYLVDGRCGQRSRDFGVEPQRTG